MKSLPPPRNSRLPLTAYRLKLTAYRLKNIQLDIISLTRPVFTGKITSVTVPGFEGELTILPGHVPLISPLKAGEVTIRHEEDEEKYVAISSGFLVVDPNHLTILADSADFLEELDEKKVEELRERAERLLEEKKFSDDRAHADAAALLEKSIAQLRLIKRRKKH